MNKSKVALWIIVSVGLILGLLIAGRFIANRLGVSADTEEAVKKCHDTRAITGDSTQPVPGGVVGWDGEGDLVYCSATSAGLSTTTPTSSTTSPQEISTSASSPAVSSSTTTTPCDAENPDASCPTSTSSTSGTATADTTTPVATSTVSTIAGSTTTEDLIGTSSTTSTTSTSPTDGLEADTKKETGATKELTVIGAQNTTVGEVVRGVIETAEDVELKGFGVKSDQCTENVDLGYNVDFKKISAKTYKFAFYRNVCGDSKNQADKFVVQAVDNNNNLYESKPIEVPQAAARTFRSWWFILWFLIVPSAGIMESMLSIPLSLAQPLLISSISYFSLPIFIFASLLFAFTVSFVLYKIVKVKKTATINNSKTAKEDSEKEIDL